MHRWLLLPIAWLILPHSTTFGEIGSVIVRLRGLELVCRYGRGGPIAALWMDGVDLAVPPLGSASRPATVASVLGGTVSHRFNILYLAPSEPPCALSLGHSFEPAL